MSKIVRLNYRVLHLLVLRGFHLFITHGIYSVKVMSAFLPSKFSSKHNARSLYREGGLWLMQLSRYFPDFLINPI